MTRDRNTLLAAARELYGLARTALSDFEATLIWEVSMRCDEAGEATVITDAECDVLDAAVEAMLRQIREAFALVKRPSAVLAVAWAEPA